MKILFVARHYWPWFDDTARGYSHLAHVLNDRGHQTTVATALDHPTWPKTIDNSDVMIHRVAPAPIDRKTVRLYSKNLAAKLKTEASSANLVVVTKIGLEATVTIKTLQNQIPIVVCAEGKSSKTEGTLLQRRQLHQAQAIVVPNESTRQIFIKNRFRGEKIHTIAPGVPIGLRRTFHDRLDARKILGSLNPILKIDSDDRLIVSIANHNNQDEPIRLIKSLGLIRQKWPGAVLWLLGNQRRLAPLRELIEQQRLASQVRLIGQFDSLDTILQAADLMVDCSPEEYNQIALLEAMTAEVPVIISESASQNLGVSRPTNAVVSEPENPEKLAEAINRIFGNPGEIATMKATGRNLIEKSHSINSTVEKFESLFKQLTKNTA
jgi:glycosyltransferase involved in cell wall biosynthesis